MNDDLTWSSWIAAVIILLGVCFIGPHTALFCGGYLIGWGLTKWERLP